MERPGRVEFADDSQGGISTSEQQRLIERVNMIILKNALVQDMSTEDSATSPINPAVCNVLSTYQGEGLIVRPLGSESSDRKAWFEVWSFLGESAWTKH